MTKKLLLFLGLLSFSFSKSYALTKEEIMNIIRQLEQAGFYEEAQKYKKLLGEQGINTNIENPSTNNIDNQENNIDTDINENIQDNTEEDNTETEEGQTNPQNSLQNPELEKNLTIWKYIQENPIEAIKILEKQPKTPDVLKKLGIAYYNLGDYIQAIKYLKAYTQTTAFNDDQDKYKILILLAYAYKNIFDDNDFRKYLQYVYEHKPELLKPQDKLVLAYIYLSKDELDKVRQLINSMSDEDLKKLPKKDLRNLYGLYYVKLGYRYLCMKDYKKALKYAYKAESYGSDSKALMELKAWIYLNMGEYRKALNLFRKIVQYKKNPNIYYGMALAYAKLGDKLKAIKYLHLAERGADRLLFYKIANLYYTLGEKKQALRIIKLLMEGKIGNKINPSYSCSKLGITTNGNEELKEIPGLALPNSNPTNDLNNINPDNTDNTIFGKKELKKKSWV